MDHDRAVTEKGAGAFGCGFVEVEVTWHRLLGSLAAGFLIFLCCGGRDSGERRKGGGGEEHTMLRRRIR